MGANGSKLSCIILIFSKVGINRGHMSVLDLGIARGADRGYILRIVLDMVVGVGRGYLLRIGSYLVKTEFTKTENHNIISNIIIKFIKENISIG